MGILSKSDHRARAADQSRAVAMDHPVIRPWSPIVESPGRVMADRALGERLWDADGTEYIDASSLNAACGYGRLEIVAAASDQMARMQGVDLSMHDHDVAARLARRLSAHLPAELSRILFTNSGSEGIEAACFVAASYHAHLGRPRTRVVTFARGYHGSTTLARSLSQLGPTAHWFNDPIRVTPVTIPGTDRDARDPATSPLLLAAFAEAITQDPADAPMAVLVEPLINVGGGVVLPPGFLRGLRKLCDEHGVLLIIDEVFTGIGRTGRMFGFQHEEITPDIVVSSKGLSGGYAPIAAVAIQDYVYQTFVDDPFFGGVRYGHTTSGHPVACAASIAVLDVIEKDGLVDNARRMGTRLLDGLASSIDRSVVRDVRGLGMLVILEMDGDDSAAALAEGARKQRLLVRQQGPIVMVVPPLTADADVIDDIVSRMRSALDGVDG
ncbi:aminotransferase class III-fold pyridoxal phosphate-dependent enzyme [Solwaraspora sp. WMMD1047]|uniref:aminotransferase family protein n=1 Tax=Solwaraspora sp. WMMD1047 TaxID=3016102 RepID=UPI0024166810|nr:aminotransferase class III-fold pyridoxal phosphate-dependent enzyme [Solwaraspora sp. WMMD1047]MDG4829289.1 aminotransferase class III-fold pyridoxal phosphate-dependent enzyme [Solwaraspora sp. WMMD1047]